MVVRPSPAGIARLRAEVAGDLEVDDAALARVLADLVEAEPEAWERRFSRTPRLAVKLSALLAMRGVPGLVRPRLLDDCDKTACYRSLAHRLAMEHPDRAAALETVLRRLVALVPRPVDLAETRRVLELCCQWRVPSSVESLLDLLGAPRPIVVGGVPIDPRDAATTMRCRPDPGLALALLEAGVLPSALATWMRERLERYGERSAATPLRVIAGLPAEAAALALWAAPARPPRWSSAQQAIAHLARLARVLAWTGPPSVCPPPSLLGRVVVGASEAASYEEALAADAEELAEEITDHEGLGEPEARNRAARRLMTGFRPFVDYLEAARQYGAPMEAIPKPIPVERRSTTRYQGVDPKLCPPPEVALRLLALAPELLEGDELRELVVLQLVSGARASVVLALRRRWVVEVGEGLLFFVPWQANKTGRGLLFVPAPFVRHYGITPEWLPEAAPLDPPQYRRDELAAAIERLCQRFEEKTGTALPHTSVRFTRSMLAQLYRCHVHGNARDAVTALLGHRRRATRANYLRTWPEEIEAAGHAWRLGDG